MEETAVHRIEKLRIHYKLKTSELEDKIGYSSRGFANSLKNNSAVKDTTLVSVLEAFPDVRVEWLLLGEGAMLKSQGSNYKDLKNYHRSEILKHIMERQDEFFEDKNFISLLQLGLDKNEIKSNLVEAKELKEQLMEALKYFESKK